MNHDPITVELRGEKTSDRPAELISALIDIRRLPSFAHALLDHHSAWHCICLFEDDLLAFRRRNRFCGAVDSWEIAVGRCVWPETHLEDVPKYVGWGAVQAWLEYEDSVITVGISDRGSGGPDVLVWDHDEFVAGHGADTYVRADLADDSAMVLNRSFRSIAELEGSFGEVPEKVSSQVIAEMERKFNDGTVTP